MVKRAAAPLLDHCYTLETTKKQKYHDDTPPGENETNIHYMANSVPTRFGPLTEVAALNANYFVEYAYGDTRAKMPWLNEYGNEELRFHFENEKCMGFLGVGNKDIAHMWHMNVIPKIRDQDLPIRWIFDLEPHHIPLLHNMRKSALHYISMNRSYFMEMYPDLATKWLAPENIKIGFHTVPSIAYLHMHVLVGPITDYGDEIADKWVPFEKVNEYLNQDKDMNVLMNSYRI